MLDVNYKRITREKFSLAWVVDIKILFERWAIEYLLEHSSDAMKYVVIEERLMYSLRKKWKDAK